MLNWHDWYCDYYKILCRELRADINDIDSILSKPPSIDCIDSATESIHSMMGVENAQNVLGTITYVVNYKHRLMLKPTREYVL